jgi:Flp pilus assembly protein TadD
LDRRKKQQALSVIPSDWTRETPMLTFFLGCALHEPGTLVEAAAAYRKSLEINPGQLEALANLGDAYLQMGQIEKAKSTLADAAKVNSNDSKLHRSLGELYLKLGMRDDAQREHEVLKQLDPSLANDLAKLLDTSAHSFHEKAGRGQDILRFFLSVSLFPFS